MLTRNGPRPVGTPRRVCSDTDVPQAPAFCTAMLGRRVEVTGPGSGGHATAYTGERRVAGLRPKQDPDPAGGWSTCLSTADARPDAGRVTAAGGELLIPPSTVMDMGVMVLAVDPVGAAFGLWLSGAHTGVELAGSRVRLRGASSSARKPRAPRSSAPQRSYSPTGTGVLTTR